VRNLLAFLARTGRALARIGLPRELWQARRAEPLGQLAGVGARHRHD
jgi:hypothetical protein